MGKPCKTKAHQSPNGHEIFMDSCCTLPKISTTTDLDLCRSGKQTKNMAKVHLRNTRGMVGDRHSHRCLFTGPPHLAAWLFTSGCQITKVIDSLLKTGRPVCVWGGDGLTNVSGRGSVVSLKRRRGSPWSWRCWAELRRESPLLIDYTVPTSNKTKA